MRDLRLFYSSVLAISTAAFAAGCHSDRNKPIAPPDSYLLFVPARTAAPAWPACTWRKADIKTPAVQPLPRLFETGFASEMLRTVYLAGQYLRDAVVDGRRFPDLARANGSLPVCLVVGRMPRPTLAACPSRAASADPRIAGLALDRHSSRTRARQGPASNPHRRLADYAAHLVATGGLLDAAPRHPRHLVDGYRMAMEVVAREWRTTAGPAGVIQVDEGTAEQRELFGNIRENRYHPRRRQHGPAVGPPASRFAWRGRDHSLPHGPVPRRRAAGRARGLLRPVRGQPHAARREPGGHSGHLQKLPGQAAGGLGQRGAARERRPRTSSI
jgi:hypothetical protein